MRSNFERLVASELDLAGIDYEYEPFLLQYLLRMRSGVCGSCGESHAVFSERWYLPDFVVGKDIIEAKGRFTSRDRTKMLAVVEGHPEYRVRMWFLYDNKLNKNSKTRYSDWCEKHNICYHVGKTPPPWLKELKK